MQNHEQTHDIFGGRSAYEAKHLLKNSVERAGDIESLHGIHNEMLGRAVQKAKELRIATGGLNDRLIELGRSWQELVGSSGNELNQQINAYIEEWAEIDRVFSGLEQKRVVAEKAESGESETQALLGSFDDFIQKHSGLIAVELKQGKDLAGIFYDNFYSEDIDNRQYIKGEPKYEKMQKNYVLESDRVLDRFMALSKEHQNDKLITPGFNSIQNGWVYFKLNGGSNPSGKRGRLYLNIQPDKLAKFYEDTLPVLQRSGLHVDAKISQTAKPEEVNRYDKMVIYFDESEQSRVSAVVGKLYTQNAEIFSEGTPKFTTAFMDSQGKSMTGISFGEEPGPEQGGQSFGDVRSKILADVYVSAQRGGYDLSAARAQQDFRSACKKYGVDQDNPAFNANTNIKITS